MGGKHGLDRVRGVGAQCILDPVEINGRAFAEIHQIDSYSLQFGHLGPTMAETPGGRDQNTVARVEGIDQRRLPRAVAVGNVDRHVLCRASDGAQVRDEARCHLDEVALVDIGGGAVHGAQHLFGHDRGAGNGQIGAAVGKAHWGLSWEVRAGHYAALRRRQSGSEVAKVCAAA